VDAAFVLVVMAILVFAFTNGFHDAANAIATLVATQGARRRPPWRRSSWPRSATCSGRAAVGLAGIEVILGCAGYGQGSPG